MPQNYEPSPAAQAIERNRKSLGLSVRAAAADASISEGRWRQIAKGYQSAAGGMKVPVNAPPETLARMARAVKVPTQLMIDAVPEVGHAMLEISYREAYPDGPPPFDPNDDSYDSVDALRELEDWIGGEGGPFPPGILSSVPDQDLIAELQKRLAQLRALQRKDVRNDADAARSSAPTNRAPVSGVDYDEGVGDESLPVEQEAGGDD